MWALSSDADQVGEFYRGIFSQALKDPRFMCIQIFLTRFLRQKGVSEQS